MALSLEKKCRKVINGDRCKHNMLYEYCALCQRIEIQENYGFKFEKRDEDGNPTGKYGFGRGIRTRIEYMQYRGGKGIC